MIDPYDLRLNSYNNTQITAIVFKSDDLNIFRFVYRYLVTHNCWNQSIVHAFIIPFSRTMPNIYYNSIVPGMCRRRVSKEISQRNRQRKYSHFDWFAFMNLFSFPHPTYDRQVDFCSQSLIATTTKCDSHFYSHSHRHTYDRKAPQHTTYSSVCYKSTRSRYYNYNDHRVKYEITKMCPCSCFVIFRNEI